MAEQVIPVLDIDLPRNGVYIRELSLTDDDGAALDITGATFEADAGTHAGYAGVASATFTPDGDPTTGRVTIKWTGSDFDAYGNLAEISYMVYDVKMTLGATPYILMRGLLKLIPGVTA